MARLLIYLSFLSLPGAEELGLLRLTAVYVALVLISPLIVVMARPNASVLMRPIGSPATIGYLAALVLFLALNFVVGQINEVSITTWAARAAHLMLVPACFLTFRTSGASPQVLFRDICIIGAIETALVYAAFLFYFDTAELRRATDLAGVIVYSVCMVCTAFYCLEKYEARKSYWFLFGYLLVLVASVLTGTRILLLAIAILPFGLRSKTRIFYFLVLFALVLLPLASLGLFGRFNLGEDENVVTISSKIEELRVLGGYFLESPLVGVGLGKVYQVSMAYSAYTYSHNIVFFYLGYMGAVGAVLALWPLARLALVRHYRILVIAIFVFYASSTTYTNVKHSLLLAVVLLVLEQRRQQAGKGWAGAGAMSVA